MVIHHIVTVMLTTFSYTAGFFRIGSVIILLHDLADIFLEVSFVSKCRLMPPGFVQVLEKLESPGIFFWHFSGLEATGPGKFWKSVKLN